MEKDPQGQKQNKFQNTVPTEIEALRQQVETWRRTRHGKTRVPDELWVKALVVAKKIWDAQNSPRFRVTLCHAEKPDALWSRRDFKSKNGEGQ